MTRTRRRSLMIGLAAGVVVLCYLRLYFGVDLTDESFYSALPYEYVLGNRPYVDEVLAGQSFGLVTYPLVWAHHAVASQDGLVLTLRHAYFMLVSGVAVLALLLLRRVVAWPWLLAGGLIYMSLTPLSLPSLSYNTLAAAMLTYGFVFGLRYLLVSRASPLLFLAGLCHATAAVAYGPLLLLLPVYVVALGVLRADRRFRTFLPYCLGALVPLSIWGAVVLVAGPSNVLHSFSFVREAGPVEGGWDKIKAVLAIGPSLWAISVAPAIFLAMMVIVFGGQRRGLLHWFVAVAPIAVLSLVAMRLTSGYLALLDVALAAAYAVLVAVYGLQGARGRRSLVLWRREPGSLGEGWRVWLLSLIPFAGLFLVVSGYESVYWALFYIILVAAYVGLVAVYQMEPSVSRRSLALWGLVPAACAGFITAYSSSHGFMGAWTGLAPCLLIAGITLGLVARQSSRGTSDTHARWLRPASVVAVLVAGLLFQWVAVYRDAAVPDLTSRVHSGPYSGLFTTAQRRSTVQGLAGDIRSVAKEGDKILFLQVLPGGYLLSTVQPAGPSVWLLDPTANPAVGAWYADTGRTPSIVVDMREMPNVGVRRKVTLWGAQYEAVAIRNHYMIYRRSAATARPTSHLPGIPSPEGSLFPAGARSGRTTAVVVGS